MRNIGIIVAMQEELEEILKIIEETNKKEIYDITYIEGKVGENNIIITLSGIGKVNAARTTQILIDKLNVECIINVGSAGALNPILNIGDIVIGNKLIQHDFDITAFNHKKGYITGVGDYLECNEDLVKQFEKITNNIENKEYKTITGIIASGDIFCTEINMKNKIYSKFNAECVEMEGAAIAQVAYLCNIPFIVIRSISDSPNGNNAIVFDEFVKLASARCAKILKEFFKK
ncbi:MAG: 5'-methylthioadenosine/adenosylhomocysteine nucleosidase [Clostridia bacterium]|jgi:adenosylhomocysteine nucleosidase|nr:5'-methylthioadenosine/adenosylhomocysteine nucleosidase [Clostridia bacterium]